MTNTHLHLSQQELKRIQENKLFDESWYLNEYPDVKKLNIDSLTHYLNYGWKLGRNPSSIFDTKAYLKNYPDAATTNIFSHYLNNQNETSKAAQTINLQPRNFTELERTQAQLNETQKLLEKYFIRCQELETEIIKLKIQNRKTKKNLDLSRSQKPLTTVTQEPQWEIN